ncbi:DoxX family protein [Rhodococcus sp. HNM0569]|uniref:DoxX family protein n=1 Tax=Rhodococcus sp. HNM0569 TaxID=2716340 RepID=UPI00146CAE08|nr:DoxX family protein [Rhodococcus sp. HNM0569]NLU83050.1 DoxX family protein [Rhodococcus sp. HNM0569]
MLVRRIARPLLGSIFVFSGVDALRDPAGRASVASPWIDKTTGALPDSVTDPVPTDAETLVRVNGAVQVAGGVMLSLGKFPRLSSTVLAGSLVPTTLAAHDFWAKDDPAERSMQRTQFLKNLGLLGGLLLAAVDTEGKPSLGWRGRRAARRAQEAVTSALPSSGQKSGQSATLDAAAERAQALGEVASDKGGAFLEVARERGTELAKTARGRGAEIAELARERGAELGEVARDRGAEWGELARDRGAEWGELARERGSELSDVAKDRAPELADTVRGRTADFAARAAAQREELEKKARKNAKKAEKSRAELRR